jgi:VanZ family protein
MTDLQETFSIASRPLLVRRAWWAIAWFGVALVIYLSLMHNPPRLTVQNGDKLEHIAAYATLMLWFAQLLPKRGQRIACAAALVGLGVAIEFLQGLTDYRAFSVWDMVADAIGVAAGWLLAPPRLPDLLALTVRLAVRI